MNLSDITTPALAYLGDSVLEVCVRTYLVTERGLSTSAHLNRASLDFVRASAQSEAMGRMEPCLTEEESAVYRRGRNMGSGICPSRDRACAWTTYSASGTVCPVIRPAVRPVI